MTRLRGTAGLTLLVLVFIAASVVEVAVGPMSIPFDRVVPDTWAYFHGNHAPDMVVLGAIRWPRLCVATLVGAGLAATGAVLQAIFRNSMADPGIIGVSGGGSLGAVIVIASGLADQSPWYTPLGAFCAGLFAMMLVYRLGTVGGRTAIHTFLLSGVAVGSLCSAVLTLVLSLEPMQTMQQILFWLMGGFDGSNWGDAGMLAVFFLLSGAVYAGHARALDILSIGEEQAEGVGVNLQQAKRTLLFVAALMVGACVSVSGIIGFVGLIVPHLMRIWMGPQHRWLLPASALGGAVLVIASDIVARMAVAPSEINVGIVTSCLGAPFFLYLLRRQYAWSGRR
ncbi:MAG: iron ABC transporter permease [Alicyclobacillus sp.]|nr:iron ABC transporter permease [Alicyclobacillus sp.]